MMIVDAILSKDIGDTAMVRTTASVEEHKTSTKTMTTAVKAMTTVCSPSQPCVVLVGSGFMGYVFAFTCLCVCVCVCFCMFLCMYVYVCERERKKERERERERERKSHISVLVFVSSIHRYGLRYRYNATNITNSNWLVLPESSTLTVQQLSSVTACVALSNTSSARFAQMPNLKYYQFEYTGWCC